MWLHMLSVFSFPLSFIVWDAPLIWGPLKCPVCRSVAVCMCVCTIDVGASEVPYAEVYVWRCTGMTCLLCLKRKYSNRGFMSVCVVLILKLCTCVCVCACPQAGAGLREAVVTVIWTCQYARRGSADKLQIVSIADERSAGDAGGVTLDWPLLNKSHLPPSSRRPYL